MEWNLLEQDEGREDESEAHCGRCTGELERHPDVGNQCGADEHAACQKAGEERETQSIVSKRGGIREQERVEVKAERKVQEREHQHDVHCVADANNHADRVRERHPEVGVEVGQDVVADCISKQKVAEGGRAEVDGSTDTH